MIQTSLRLRLGFSGSMSITLLSSASMSKGVLMAHSIRPTARNTQERLLSVREGRQNQSAYDCMTYDEKIHLCGEHATEYL